MAEPAAVAAPAARSRALPIVCVVAFALRCLLLFARGEYIVYDEGYYLLLARSLRAGEGFALGGLPHVALSPLQPIIVAALSFTGLPDVWASRLLAAAAGALLVLPVAWLARRWGGERASLPAAIVTATAPPLLTFTPFFPGGWNLYFGSEPLFLLIATTALVAAVRAVDDGGARWWALFGVLAALAYLTRLEGAVLGVLLGVVAGIRLVVLGRARWLPRLALAAAAGALVASPYFLHLRSALGRWAVSGRVQAAATEQPEPNAPAVKAERRDALQAFVWGGEQEALWRALYALDASGTRMRSQYWGVPTSAMLAAAARAPRTANPAPVSPAPGTPTPAPASPAPRTANPAPALPPLPSVTRQMLRAARIVLPWLLVLGAITGLWVVRPGAEAWTWLAAPLLTVAVPALLAYVEPRAFLLLVPVACVLSGAGAAAVAVRLAPGAARALGAAVTLLLLYPAARDFVRAWPQTSPLQQAATGRRVVGEYLGPHLAADSRIVSWHPAVAIWARREWRVLPYDDFDRIVRYARAQDALTLVLTSLEPSPLRNPPRAFTIVLLDSATQADNTMAHLEEVESTPLLFVGRLTPTPPAAPAVPAAAPRRAPR